MSETLTIRRVAPSDAPRLTEIYNWYVQNAITTFETETIDTTEMQQWVQDCIHSHDWIVGERDDRLVGNAYYVAFRSRAAYAIPSSQRFIWIGTAFGRGSGPLSTRS